MINFDITLTNPWARDNFKNLFCKEEPLTLNKNYSFEILYHNPMLAKLSFEFNWRGQDHAGPGFEFGILGYSIAVKIYDTRHWDRESNGWQQYK